MACNCGLTMCMLCCVLNTLASWDDVFFSGGRPCDLRAESKHSSPLTAPIRLEQVSDQSCKADHLPDNRLPSTLLYSGGENTTEAAARLYIPMEAGLDSTSHSQKGDFVQV